MPQATPIPLPADANPEIGMVTTVSTELGRCISALIGAVSPHPCRPTDLVKLLGVNKDLASRVMTAVSTADPLAAAFAMPGPTPLRSLVRGAQRRGVSATLVHEADGAIDSYERLLNERVGDKTGLNALIGAWLPEAREEVDVTARHLVYRGASLVKGLHADVSLITFVVHRSQEDPLRCDTAMIGGWVGLRRIRPRVPMRFIARLVHPKGGPGRMFDSAGDPFYDRFMEEFSEQPLPVSIRPSNDRREYWLDDRGVGPRSSVRVFLTEFYRTNHPLQQLNTGLDRRRFFFTGIDIPVKTLVFDVLVAEDVWTGVEPELRVYETAANGTANPNDAVRDIDLMDPPTAIRKLGTGIDRFRSANLPDYPTMLASVAEAHGWARTRFRGYRIQLEYPMYSSQVCMVFDPPA